MTMQRKTPRRVVVITGASAGVGRATAIAFAERGWAVALLARNRDRLESARRDVEAAGGAALVLPCDVADADAVFTAAERAMSKKRADYFAAGTQVVWDVDLLGANAVRVYRKDAPEQPTVYRRGEIAEAEPALPGWSMPVDDLFW